MAEGNGGQTTAIIVALIGLVGVLGAAYIATQPKAAERDAAPTIGSEQSDPKSVVDTTPAVSGGEGRDVQKLHGGADTLAEKTTASDASSAVMTYPDFAGSWVEENSASPARIHMTQIGNQVTWENRTLNIRADGTVGYQTFAAGSGAGHEVSTADAADLIDTFALARQGPELIFSTIFDTRHPYSNTPVGTRTRIIRYLREQ